MLCTVLVHAGCWGHLVGHLLVQVSWLVGPAAVAISVFHCVWVAGRLPLLSTGFCAHYISVCAAQVESTTWQARQQPLSVEWAALS